MSCRFTVLWPPRPADEPIDSADRHGYTAQTSALHAAHSEHEPRSVGRFLKLDRAVGGCTGWQAVRMQSIHRRSSSPCSKGRRISSRAGSPGPALEIDTFVDFEHR